MSYSETATPSWWLYMRRVFWLAWELLRMVLREDWRREADWAIA